MPDFGIEVDGERLVALRFEQFPERARAAIKRRLEALTAQLYSRVESAEPQRTGKLRQETQSFVDERDDRVTGRVKVLARETSEHGKGAALEYGAHGSAQVGAHAMTLSHLWGRMIAPRQVLVAAYSRRVNISERRYLRGSLDTLRGEVIEQLRQALAEAMSE
jgi:hypothetical protein